MPYDDEDGLHRSVVLSGLRTVDRHAYVAPDLERRVVTEQVRPRDVVAETALGGLLAPRKTLPPSLFYDEEGCRLFYEITKLPEYYLTRPEFRLLETIAPEVAALLPAGATLVEYGASDETKAEMLLRQTTPEGSGIFQTYIPIDVAAP